MEISISHALGRSPRCARSRRSRALAAASAASAGLLFLAGCSSSDESGADGESQSFVMVSWGGTWTEATKEYLTDPFTEETGIEVEIVENSSYTAGLEAQAEAGRIEWDLLDGTSAQDAYMLDAEGLLATVPDDVKEAVEDALFDGALEEDFGVHGPGLGYVLACTDAVTSCPENMAEFFDTEDGVRYTSIATLPLLNLTIAEMANGVAAEDISTHEIDMDRAFATLEALSDSVPVWWESGAQLVQIFESDEVDLGISYNGRAFELEDAGIVTEINWNEGIYNSGFWNVPADAPNADAAWEFVKWWANNPEAQANWAMATGYSVSSDAAFDYLDEGVAETLPDWPSNREGLAVMNYQWYVENYEEVNARWQEFLLG